MLNIISERTIDIAAEPIAAAGLQPVYRVLTVNNALDGDLLVEILSPRTRAHRVCQAGASANLLAEIVFDRGKSPFIILRLQGQAPAVNFLLKALRANRFKMAS